MLRGECVLARHPSFADPLHRAAQVSATVDGQASNVYLWRKDRARVTAAWRGDAAPMDALPTDGGTLVVFEGEHFGSNTSATDAQGRISVSATYATREGANDDSVVYSARDCAVTERYRRIECTTVEGVGVHHVWTIFVDGDVVSRAATTSYGAPAVERVEVIGECSRPYSSFRP